MCRRHTQEKTKRESGVPQTRQGEKKGKACKMTHRRCAKVKTKGKGRQMSATGRQKLLWFVVCLVFVFIFLWFPSFCLVQEYFSKKVFFWILSFCLVHDHFVKKSVLFTKLKNFLKIFKNTSPWRQLAATTTALPSSPLH